MIYGTNICGTQLMSRTLWLSLPADLETGNPRDMLLDFVDRIRPLRRDSLHWFTGRDRKLPPR